jgi:hypothetical protein
VDPTETISSEDEKCSWSKHFKSPEEMPIFFAAVHRVQ